jgi:hypothetical protein
MTPVFRFCRALLVGFGIAVTWGSVARSQDNPSDSTRDSIIQSVRDDVRRKIGDQQSAERRKSGTVGQTSSRVPRPKKSKKQIN